MAFAVKYQTFMAVSMFWQVFCNFSLEGGDDYVGGTKST